ncbi:MAG: lysostaphin resistance A-like protein [Candidatus Cryptobacteroides sp.]
MGFFNPRKVEKSFDIIGAFSWYTPGISGLFSVLGWFLVGMLLSMLIAVPLTLSGMQMCYLMLIIYPLQFMPVLIYAKVKSSRNATFDRGYRLDSNHFGSKGGLVTGLLAAVAMIAASMMLELVNSFLPEMSEQLKSTMEMMTGGPLIPSLVCVGIFAPLFEEWMCRGIVLRGLLNYNRVRPGKEQNGKGISPALAIVISALFFAAIHGNLWQGVSAFLIGCLFGYVYYRTGSLKLTMLMHCVNNTFSVLLAHFGSEAIKEADTILDVLPGWEYAVVFAVSALVVWYFIRTLSRIAAVNPNGNNCDIIPSPEDELA